MLFKVIDEEGNIFKVYGVQCGGLHAHNTGNGMRFAKSQFLIFRYEQFEWVEMYDFKPYEE